MYDSDEVRDKMWGEMMGVLFTPRAAGLPLSAVERMALEDARVTFAQEFQAVLVEYLKRRDERTAAVAWMERFVEELVEAFRPLLEKLGTVARRVVEEVREFAAAVGLMEGRDEVDEFPWQRRPRVADVRPLRMVDAVAAGRGPAMTMRTRIRGGRR